MVVGFFGLIGWRLYTNIQKSDGPGHMHFSQQVAVEAAPVSKATIWESGNYSGTLLPGSHFIVAPKVGGRMEKLYVDIGDQVKSGQLIAVLESEEYTQQVEQARAELQVAYASVEEARNAVDV